MSSWGHAVLVGGFAYKSDETEDTAPYATIPRLRQTVGHCCEKGAIHGGEFAPLDHLSSIIDVSSPNGTFGLCDQQLTVPDMLQEIRGSGTTHPPCQVVLSTGTWARLCILITPPVPLVVVPLINCLPPCRKHRQVCFSVIPSSWQFYSKKHDGCWAASSSGPPPVSVPQNPRVSHNSFGFPHGVGDPSDGNQTQ
jgi:hypothetical protein